MQQLSQYCARIPSVLVLDNRLQNKMGHHDSLGRVPLSPHSMLEFQVKIQSKALK